MKVLQFHQEGNIFKVGAVQSLIIEKISILFKPSSLHQENRKLLEGISGIGQTSPSIGLSV